MQTQPSKRPLLDPDAFEAATLRLRSLKARLPEDTVTALAREVLERVAARATAGSIPTGRINALAMALIDPDRDLCRQIILDIEAQGTPVESLYLDYLAAAARRLGDLWTEDRVSFADVTLGTARIYGILRTIDTPLDRAWPGAQPLGLFVSVPGEAHVLGIRMAADLFRRQGWEIELLVGLDHAETVARFAASQHMLVGLSAADERGLLPLARLLLALRAERPGVRVLVSGHIVDAAPGPIDELSPDASASDFETAFAEMTRLWAERTL